LKFSELLLVSCTIFTRKQSSNIGIILTNIRYRILQTLLINKNYEDFKNKWLSKYVSKLGFCPVLFRNELVAFQKELVLFKKYTQTFGLFILPLEKNRCWIFKNSIWFLYQVSSWIGLISFLIVRFYSISKSYIIIKFSSENNKHLCLSLILMI